MKQIYFKIHIFGLHPPPTPSNTLTFLKGNLNLLLMNDMTMILFYLCRVSMAEHYRSIVLFIPIFMLLASINYDIPFGHKTFKEPL